MMPMKAKTQNPPNRRLWHAFLKDVFICSLGAYGGPEAHYGVFADQLVEKKKYITEEELAELIAVTGVLPGPSSTQTIVAVGLKIGGPVLGLLTMLVWALPVLVVMTALSFLSQILQTMNISQAGLRYIGPMAVGFIVVAAWRLGRKVVTGRLTLVLFLAGALITYFVRQPWVYPAVLLLGGAAGVATSREKNAWNRVSIRPPWGYLAVFGVFAICSLVLAMITNNPILHLFESFYRYGYLVIGGGQVVVPLMYSELVEINQSMTNSEFLTGFGLVQGLPGPMFSFAAYAGGMAARGGSTLLQILGATAGGIAIFFARHFAHLFCLPRLGKLKTNKRYQNFAQRHYGGGRWADCRCRCHSNAKKRLRV
jgi:chromate transporter